VILPYLEAEAVLCLGCAAAFDALFLLSLLLLSLLLLLRVALLGLPMPFATNADFHSSKLHFSFALPLLGCGSCCSAALTSLLMLLVAVCKRDVGSLSL
jgi:hypothetical protein